MGFTAAALVHELMEARDERRLLNLQRQLSLLCLLIIDELGFVPLSPTRAELIFEAISLNKWCGYLCWPVSSDFFAEHEHTRWYSFTPPQLSTSSDYVRVMDQRLCQWLLCQANSYPVQ